MVNKLKDMFTRNGMDYSDLQVHETGDGVYSVVVRDLSEVVIPQWIREHVEEVVLPYDLLHLEQILERLEHAVAGVYNRILESGVSATRASTLLHEVRFSLHGNPEMFKHAIRWSISRKIMMSMYPVDEFTERYRVAAAPQDWE